MMSGLDIFARITWFESLLRFADGLDDFLISIYLGKGSGVLLIFDS